MAQYTPDAWIPVLIESEEHGKVYKILASWYGGFAGSDYWKLSSGIESVSIEENTFVMPQSSGSTYVVSKNPHMSMLIGSMLATFKEQAKSLGASFEEISVEQLLAAFAPQQ